MPHRFYCETLVESGSVILTDSEAHHLIHVLRAKPGDLVQVFNGMGLVASCRIAAIRKRDAELEIVSSQQTESPQRSFTIAAAVPKGDRFDWLVEKATELGVSRLIPLMTTRSVVDPRAHKLEKLRQTVIAACKQSGRNHLMEIAGVISWPDFLMKMVPTHRVLVAHPTTNDNQDGDKNSDNVRNPIAVAIGPEGGFTDEEIQLAAAAGAATIQLGEHILRIETAAIALAAKFLI